MALSIGIVGLPNVGKSTLFKALTRNQVLIANYPFATIEPNTGVVPVPDERLARLASIANPKKIIPASVQFVDIAGLVAGAHRGEGLGNKFLAHIRQTQAICLVTRAFDDPDVAGDLHPERDITTIKTELVLADLQTLDSIKQRFAKLTKGTPSLKVDLDQLEKLYAHLDKGRWPLYQDYKFTHPDLASLDKNLLTAKPIIYAFNIDEATLKDQSMLQSLGKLVAPAKPIFISAKLEAELSELAPAEAADLMKSEGITHSGLENLIKVGYDTLKLETFFTAGPDEVRAWTIKKGSNAPEAAGTIHTDFSRGFIAAEVVKYGDLLAAGSFAVAKTRGKIRSEGKDYIVSDGDVITFRFNV